MVQQLQAYQTAQSNHETPFSTLLSVFNFLESSLMKIDLNSFEQEQFDIREKSVYVVGLLMTSLDFEENKSVADNLAGLYIYINKILIDYTSSQKDIDSCIGIIGTIRDGFVLANEELQK